MQEYDLSLVGQIGIQESCVHTDHPTFSRTSPHSPPRLKQQGFQRLNRLDVVSDRAILDHLCASPFSDGDYSRAIDVSVPRLADSISIKRLWASSSMWERMHFSTVPRSMAGMMA